jgi:hypothetical protein
MTSDRSVPQPSRLETVTEKVARAVSGATGLQANTTEGTTDMRILSYGFHHQHYVSHMWASEVQKLHQRPVSHGSQTISLLSTLEFRG